MGWIHTKLCWEVRFLKVLLQIWLKQHKETELLSKGFLMVNNRQSLTERSLQSVKKRLNKWQCDVLSCVLLLMQRSSAIPIQTVRKMDIWDVSAVCCSFFLRNCCCQEKSSCASLCFLKIVPSYHTSLDCPPTTRSGESKSPKQTIDSHTLSPQIGKDHSKPGQTHLLCKLKQLPARVLLSFSCF